VVIGNGPLQPQFNRRKPSYPGDRPVIGGSC
jgi:hypothetical protein